MSKPFTTEQFIAKAISIHQTRYDYKLVNYTNKRVKVRLICPVHGEFEMPPLNHLKGNGCKFCALDAKAKQRTLTNAQFVERLKILHGDVLPFTLLEKYTHSQNNIKLSDAFGKCSIAARDLLVGTLPRISNAIDKTAYSIEQFKSVHGDKYDYSKYIYKNGKLDKSTIICRIHGEFELSRQVHLRGGNCIKCNKNSPKNIARKYTTELFIEKATKLHKGVYDYTDVNYVNNRTSVTIICKHHGKFNIRAGAHLGGQGCIVCGRSRNSSGWEPSSWQISANSSTNFDMFKVYFTELVGRNEKFYKIGRTYMSMEKRFLSIPYTYEVIHTVSHDDPKIIFDLENHLKRIFKAHKYKPLKSFGGQHECFQFDAPTIQSVLREMQISSPSDIIPTSTK